MLKIKRGDKVKVLSGKDKGKVGKVMKVLIQKNRAVVEGVNLAKKHMRRRSETEQGGIKEIPISIHLSNLALFCSNCNRQSRFAIKILEDKSKIRVCKKCSRPI